MARLKITSLCTLLLLSLNVLGGTGGTSDSTSAKTVLKKNPSVIAQMTDDQLVIIIDLLPKQYPEFFMPVCGVITSNFGWRDSAQHNGIDIDLNKGDAVVSAFDGMVRFAGKQGGFGNVIVVRHYNGLETYYAHLWK